MSTQTYCLDLDEYGIVMIEGAEQPVPDAAEAGFEQAGLGSAVERAGQQVVLKATDTIQRSLVGLASVFVGALPALEVTATHKLQKFTIEFQIGLAAEAGTSTGVVCKVTPSGAFKCTYTWERRPPAEVLAQATDD